MSRGNKWVPIDKYLVSEFKHIRREFSLIEAMFSFTVDQGKGNNWSISGYSKLWLWSRNRVRKFIENTTSETGHYRDRKRTESGHPIHFIDNALMCKPDRNRTETGQNPDTTVKPKPKKEIYSPNFLIFWEKYPKKEKKKTAFTAYQKMQEPKPSLQIVLDSIISHKKTDQWQDKQFIPLPASFLNARQWEDEINFSSGPKTESETLERHGL